jgi:hypothetical protein
MVGVPDSRFTNGSKIVKMMECGANSSHTSVIHIIRAFFVHPVYGSVPANDLEAPWVIENIPTLDIRYRTRIYLYHPPVKVPSICCGVVKTGVELRQGQFEVL